MCFLRQPTSFDKNNRTFSVPWLCRVCAVRACFFSLASLVWTLLSFLLCIVHDQRDLFPPLNDLIFRRLIGIHGASQWTAICDHFVCLPKKVTMISLSLSLSLTRRRKREGEPNDAHGTAKANGFWKLYMLWKSKWTQMFRPFRVCVFARCRKGTTVPISTDMSTMYLAHCVYVLNNLFNEYE